MRSIELDGRGLRNSIPGLLLAVMCAGVLGGILAAGLWPFHAPPNEVSWLSNGNGLLFGDYGSVLSAGAFKASNSNGGACLEIWLEPSVIDNSGTILSFYPPERRSTSFALRQSLDDLALLRKNLGEKRSARASRIYADHVFRHGTPVFLTMTSGARGTSIYVNGMLVRTSQDFRFSNEDLTGQLVIGNSSVTTDTWSGQLKGFAIYNRELTVSQVTQHYQDWVGSGLPGVSARDSAVALYLFNEGSGDAVHNQVDSATDLTIPKHFFVLHEPFLERPWKEFYSGWHYWMDIGINIAGFIPLGFFFYAYISLVRRIKHPAAVTIAFGFAVSLTIEVLQAFLPTRNSGTTDLITNTLGTATGVILCAWSMKQNWFANAGISIGCASGEKREDLQLIG
jgi:VanZ like family/Concanavalin A-like lectin/glucanases superfamily